MASDPFRKLWPGDKSIDHRGYNAMLDVAMAYQRQQLSITPGATPPPAPGLVRVKNTTENDRLRFEALNIDGPVFSSASDQSQSMQTHGLVLKGVSWSSQDIKRWRHFVVLQQPIRAGGIGWAMITGVTPAWVQTSAVVGSMVGGRGAQLNVNALGSAEVLWVASSGNPRLAVVRLGAGLTPYQYFPVQLTQTGGSNGTSSTAASYTYTAVREGTSQTLGTNLSPRLARPNGEVTAATRGIGFVANNGSFVLEYAHEVPSTEPC